MRGNETIGFLPVGDETESSGAGGRWPLRSVPGFGNQS